ncbi:MAG TPA: hypothetical protein VGX21_12895 [Methylomirabilota bacterium]|jgi:hypothetical protein|nr:hypothetical protein [Methylomirabilota bacterium]
MLEPGVSGQPPFPAGARVPRSAKYAAIHEGHHLPFQMMHLFGGEQFPSCSLCGEAVTYVEVIRSRRRERTFGARSDSRLRAI